MRIDFLSYNLTIKSSEIIIFNSSKNIIMKKIGVYFSAILMLGIGGLSTGCMGSWKLTKVVYNWNDGATGNKYIDHFLFWILNPVYGVTIMVDSVILNLIEFWTGSNPMAMKAGEKESAIVKGKDGKTYEVTVSQYKYEIAPVTNGVKGTATEIYFTPIANTWSVAKNGEVTVIAKVYPNENKAELYAKDGSVKLVDLTTAQHMALLNGAM
jgi:hypothetical protein